MTRPLASLSVKRRPKALMPAGSRTLWIQGDRNFAEMLQRARDFRLPDDAVVLGSSPDDATGSLDLDDPATLAAIGDRIVAAGVCLVVIDTERCCPRPRGMWPMMPTKLAIEPPRGGPPVRFASGRPWGRIGPRPTSTGWRLAILAWTWPDGGGTASTASRPPGFSHGMSYRPGDGVTPLATPSPALSFTGPIPQLTIPP